MIELPDITAFDDFLLERYPDTWGNSTPKFKKEAALRAIDYINAVYNIDGFEADPRVLVAVYTLAEVMLTDKIAVRAGSQAILQEEMEAGDFRDKTVYAAPSDDPYPLITSMLHPIRRRGAKVVNGLSFVSLVRA